MIRTPSVRFLDRSTPPHILTLILLTGLSALAMNIFLPSLPGMAEQFQTDYRLMQLSVALYLGVNAILQIFVGPLSDKLGRRPVLLWGMVLFILATIGCIFSPNITTFLVFRMAQSVIAVGMVLGRAAVRDMYDQDEAASMIGYVTMGMAVVPMIGPAIGGALDQQFDWHANFWLLFGLGALILWLVYTDFGETKVASGLTLRQQFQECPELLTSPRFWGYAMAATASAGTFFAYLGGAPFVGTVVYQLEPAALGFYFGAPAMGYFFGNYISGRYSLRYGINRMILVGSYITATGPILSLVMLYAGSTNPLAFFSTMTIVGLGNGMVMPNATSGTLSVRPQLAGTASGLGGAIMLGGGALLSAFAGWLLTPESGAFPLLWLQLACTVCGLLAIYVVLHRERRMGLDGP